MSRYSVDADRLDDGALSVYRMADALRTYSETVIGIYSKIENNEYVKAEFNRSIKTINDVILGQAAKLDSLADAVEYIARSYREADKKIMDRGLAGGNLLSGVSFAGWRFDWGAFLKDIRAWFINHGIIKTTKQKREEGEPVSTYQQQEMDRYMQDEIAKLNKKSQYSKEVWKKSSTSERKAILQNYIKEISTIMGLPEVKIKWTYTESQNGYANLGAFSNGTKSVSINEWIVEEGDKSGFPSYNLFSTVVHEMRHYYQHEAVEHPERYVVTEETISSWRDSFKNYKTSEGFMRSCHMSQRDAFNAYRNQAVEQDARWFAKQS